MSPKNPIRIIKDPAAVGRPVTEERFRIEGPACELGSFAFGFGSLGHGWKFVVEAQVSGSSSYPKSTRAVTRDLTAKRRSFCTLLGDIMAMGHPTQQFRREPERP